ncbi:MAG: molybdopterin-dependent oxidoreductase [Acidobacteriota bacterium]
MDDTLRTVYRACNLCEAICGLEIKVDGPKILSIRGDEADPFSRGHICPKAVALLDVHEDPNRLRRPMQRVGDPAENVWREIPWDEAFDLAAERLAALQLRHGNNAVGFYVGNPSVHNIGTLLSVPQLARVLKTRNAFSATSVDQLPQQLTSLLMFGHQLMIPIPDIDRTDYFLILGGNPVASNGSLMTVPDVTKRLAAIRKRGGKVVVIDPRRTETAAIASEHHFIRPATDAALLMAMINTMKEENLFRLTRSEQLSGLDAALAAIADITPEVAAGTTGIEAGTIRRLAREFAAAPSAVCYGRVGTTLQSFGTLNQWLVQLVNIVTGNLDREGGAMPTSPLIPITGPGTRRGHHDRWRSRVSGLPESGGELPVAVLAEEILTPGDGQIRGMITVCGNPVLSTPNGRRLDEALASLDFMLSIDIYLNETTRHADLILPPTSSLNHDHYDLIFNAFAVRNVARFNAGMWERPADERYDWEIFRELCARLAVRLEREHRPLQPTATVIEGMLTNGVSMAALTDAPHGIDLGPLRPSLFERLETPDGKIDCAPAPLLADISRFKAQVEVAPDRSCRSFSLIGRRHLRSNNSWMHNSHRLIKGKPRDQLMMHPDDLASLGLVDGQTVEVRARVGSVRIAVQSTDTLMPGVVSLPHGFGHNRAGTRLGLAEQNAGVSYNDLTDASAVDAVSGNAALNGIAVEVIAIQ